MTLDEAIKIFEDNVEKHYMDAKKTMDTLDMINLSGLEEKALDYFMIAEANKQVAEWLKELKQLREQTRWIPVSERLPEHLKYVLAYDGGAMFAAWYDKQSLTWHSVDDNFDKEYHPIIAWMPLPQAYKAESEDEE